jgi:hypothetical protein
MPDRDLKLRTKHFALRIIKLVQYLNEHGAVEARIIANRTRLNYRGQLPRLL